MSEKRTRGRTALYAMAACGLLGGGILLGRCLAAAWGKPEAPTYLVLLANPGATPQECAGGMNVLAQEGPSLATALLRDQPRDGIVEIPAHEPAAARRVVRGEGIVGVPRLLAAAPPPP